MPKGKPVPSSTNTGQSDSAKVSSVLGQAAVAAEPAKRTYRPRKQEPILPMVTPEEKEFWGRQIQMIFHEVAAVRGPHWEMRDEMATAVGEPAALTAKKYLPEGTMQQRPELVLLLVLTPFLISALKVEYVAYRARREAEAASAGIAATTPARVERRDLRPQGIGEDHAGEEFITRPVTLPDR